MIAFKAALFVLTFGCALFFAGWAMREKRRLTVEALEQQHESVSDYCEVFYDIKKDIRRERILRSLPPQALSKYRVLGILQFVFLAMLVLEVILLQR